MVRIASQADVWYNKHINIVLPERYCKYLQAWIRLDWRHIMDTLSHHASESNPTKICTKCNRELPATTEYFSRQKSNKDGLRGWCKQCQSVYRSAYYTSHQDEEKQRMSQYYVEHSEERKQYSAHYRIEHAEKVKCYEKKYNASDRHKSAKARYRATHQENIKVYRARWHEEHREHERQYSASYNAIHHDERLRYGRERRAKFREVLNARRMQYRRTEHGRLAHRIQENKRRARKLATPGTLTLEQIQYKLKAQKYRCYYAMCGHAKFEKHDGKYIYHLEHTIPLSRPNDGPRHDMDYVVLACPACNLKKNNRLPHEFWEGGRLF